MSTTNLELDPIDAVRESMLTADLARNALARAVAYWVRDSHVADTLPIQQQFLAADTRYRDLQHAYTGVRSRNGVAR